MVNGVKTTSFAHWPCSVARALDVVGDAWTVLVLRESYYGVTRFEDFATKLGIARNTLAVRLRGLVAAGLLERRPYQREPERHEYVLTEGGADFYPVMIALQAWGDRWRVEDGSAPPIELVHESCGHQLRAEVVCGDCGQPVALAQVRSRAGSSYPARLLEIEWIAERFGPRD